MVREDLVEGAVTFLQDPSVASAPVEQKLAFLRSKNLTQEEIDASLARVGQAPTGQSTSTTPTYQPQYRQQAQQYGYQQYPPYWNQPPPEPPRRDWRDWFIMATVAGGVSYAVYWTAKRYIYPLIAPPTPPQLEQDKAHIDASFEKTFALLDQLARDTQELKDAEAQRKERLDRALAEVESVIGRMKEANEAREYEAKRWGREIGEIREEIPRAIQAEKAHTDERLKDLAQEMKSLKTLVGNRVGQTPKPAFGGQGGVNGINVNGSPSQAMATPFPQPEANGTAVTPGAGADGEKPVPATMPASPAAAPYSSRLLGGKAQIPSWQLAAKKRSEDAKKESAANGSAVQDVSESGTATPVPEAEVTA